MEVQKGHGVVDRAVAAPVQQDAVPRTAGQCEGGEDALGGAAGEEETVPASERGGPEGLGLLNGSAGLEQIPGGGSSVKSRAAAAESSGRGSPFPL